MNYLVLSTSVTDELHFADGGCIPNVIGGAGSYALAGMKVWRDDVGIVTGVGADYPDLYGDWYALNGIPTKGLIIKDAHTPRNIIHYFADGERTESPRYGHEHYEKVEGTPADLERFCNGVKGVYVFKNHNRTFWEQMLDLKNRYRFRLMWEISADAAIPECAETVREISSQADVFSINRTEVSVMLGKQKLDDILSELSDWDIPMIYLRAGSSGVYTLSNGKTVFIPSVSCDAVDVTGGGNSSSGGAFIGFCETGDAVAAGIMGNISASFCIAQYGVPKILDKGIRNKAMSMLHKMKEELRNEK